MTRHFPGIVPVVIPHEDDDAVDDPPPVPNVAGTVRVCIAGGIGLHKGFQVLLRLRARREETRAGPGRLSSPARQSTISV